MYHKIIAGERQVEPQQEPQRSKFWGSKFWDIVQVLGAYVALPVGLLYPVGFFALFVQFMNYFFLDVYTAWYAASLVNRMAIIEQGVTILSLALVASVILSVFIYRVLFAHDEGGVFDGDEQPGDEQPTVWWAKLFAAVFAAVTLRGFARRGRLYAKLIGISLVIFILYIGYSRVVAGGRPTFLSLRGRLSTECNKDMVAWHQSQLWPDSLVPAAIFLVGCLWGGWLMYRFYQAYLQRLDHDPAANLRLGKALLEGVTEGWILPGLAIAYAASVAASIVLAWYTPSFQPFMTYGPTVVHRGENKKPTDNTFLSHTEGQWYFLHRIQKDKDINPKTWIPPDFTIVSLREGEVKYVRVRPIPPKVSRVAPLLGVFGEKPPQEDPCKSGIK